MNNLSASELLNIWEMGRSKTLVQQALLLLSASCPEIPIDTLAELSIGQRDALLLTLREMIFGQSLDCVASCPGCSDQLELSLNLADIRIEKKAKSTREFTTTIENCEVRFRVPNSKDIALLYDPKDLTASQEEVYGHCILSIFKNSKQISFDELPVNVKEEISDRIAKADPQADVLLDISCPSCNKKWQVVFDIVPFFWTEITAWAYRIMYEVRNLALAYGWSEKDILAMSPWRRHHYLEMISG
jgi:hypothetical protein